MQLKKVLPACHQDPYSNVTASFNFKSSRVIYFAIFNATYFAVMSRALSKDNNAAEKCSQLVTKLLTMLLLHSILEKYVT